METTREKQLQQDDHAIYEYVNLFKIASINLVENMPENSVLCKILHEYFNKYLDAVHESNEKLKGYVNTTNNWLDTYYRIRGDESGAPIMFVFGLFFVDLQESEWKELERPVELQALLVGIENDVYSSVKESEGENNILHFIAKDNDNAFEKVSDIRLKIVAEYNLRFRQV